MTTTKAYKSSGNAKSTSVTIPQSIAELLRVQHGDKISWEVENRGDSKTPYLVAVLTNSSNQETTSRKLYDEILALHQTLDFMNETIEIQDKMCETYKSRHQKQNKIIANQERLLKMYGKMDGRFQLLRELVAEQKRREKVADLQKETG